jgi:F-type H+-transporting ATPase subunit epsilon
MIQPPTPMQLRLSTPTEDLISETVTQVVAEGPEGLFALLPRHADIVAALIPGLLAYHTPDGAEHFLGIDEGVLVKCGSDLRVSVFDAIASDDLEHLRGEVARKFLSHDAHERQARTALARLEAGAIRRVLEIER